MRHAHIGLAFIGDLGKSALDIAKELDISGIRNEIRSDAHPGVSQSVIFSDPNGFLVELLQEQTIRPGVAARGIVSLLTRACRRVVYQTLQGWKILHWMYKRKLWASLA